MRGLGSEVGSNFRGHQLSPKRVEAIQQSGNVSGEASFWEGSSAEQRTQKKSTVLAQNIGSKNGTRSEVNYLIYKANSRVGGAARRSRNPDRFRLFFFKVFQRKFIHVGGHLFF